jgi:hypothetical protein
MANVNYAGSTGQLSRNTGKAMGGTTIVQEALRRRYTPERVATMLTRARNAGLRGGNFSAVKRSFQAAGLRVAYNRGTGKVLTGVGSSDPITYPK